jgi:hypothetical protein
MSSGIPADWKEFRNKHKDLIRHSKYEWDFVNDVLVNVPGLKPSQVFPQHEFVGKDGRTYHMDFAIITENVKIAVELEGFDKKGTKRGPSHSDHSKQIERLQALTLNGWKPFPITNSQFKNDEHGYAIAIRQLLSSGTENKVGSQQRDSRLSNRHLVFLGLLIFATTLILVAVVQSRQDQDPIRTQPNRQTIREFKNCNLMRQEYPDGIVRDTSVLNDPTVVKPGENPLVNRELYEINKERDGDGDGRVCEPFSGG